MGKMEVVIGTERKRKRERERRGRGVKGSKESKHENEEKWGDAERWRIMRNVA